MAAAPAMTYHVVDGAKVDSMAEDIWSGCVCRGIAASGRAGWPTAHAEQLRCPCRRPFGLAAVNRLHTISTEASRILYIAKIDRLMQNSTRNRSLDLSCGLIRFSRSLHCEMDSCHKILRFSCMLLKENWYSRYIFRSISDLRRPKLRAPSPTPTYSCRIPTGYCIVSFYSRPQSADYAYPS